MSYFTLSELLPNWYIGAATVYMFSNCFLILFNLAIAFARVNFRSAWLSILFSIPLLIFPYVFPVRFLYSLPVDMAAVGTDYAIALVVYTAVQFLMCTVVNILTYGAQDFEKRWVSQSTRALRYFGIGNNVWNRS